MRSLPNRFYGFTLTEPVRIALDAQTKLQLEDVLLDLWQAHKRSVVFITHDISEAVTLSDRVIVMKEAEDRHSTLIRVKFPDVDRPLTDLDIEDRWRRGDPDLVALILRRLRPHLGAPRGRAGA